MTDAAAVGLEKSQRERERGTFLLHAAPSVPGLSPAQPRGSDPTARRRWGIGEGDLYSSLYLLSRLARSEARNPTRYIQGSESRTDPQGLAFPNSQPQPL